MDGLTEVSSMRAAIEKSMTHNPLLIDPRTSEWTQWWDLVIVTLLVVVLFLTPYEVAFLRGGSIDVLFGVNRLFDLIFFLSVIIIFFKTLFDIFIFLLFHILQVQVRGQAVLTVNCES